MKNSKHVCLFFICRATQPGHYLIVFITPQKSLLKSSYQKNTCQIFAPKKILESKISNPKKSFDHLCHMKSRVPPLGWEVCGTFRLLTRNKFDWGYVLFLDWYLLRVGNFKPPQKGSWLLSKLLTSTFVLFLWESPCPPPSFPSPPPYKAL